MANDAETLARRFFELMNSRDVDALDEVFDPDVVFHGMEVRGLGQLKDKLGEIFHGFPDIEISIEDLVASGDRVAVRLWERGTHTGEFEGIPATGRPFEGTEMNFVRVADGRIAEVWQLYDQLSFLTQLGVIGEQQEAALTEA